ncbi:MAG: alginate export family protein [Desulfobulbus sp.]|nr:alginate export family protein [Desulfobulbus sp.]
MKRVNSPLAVGCVSLLAAATLMAGNVFAADEETASLLQFYTGPNGSYARATLEADLGFFGQGDSWFGNSRENLGKKSDYWWESLIRPGLDLKYVLPDSQSFYGRIDAVQANTFGGVDASGTNGPFYDTSEDVGDLRIDRAYVGWRSGTLFGSLGEDFLDLSFGRLQYFYGDGFLLGSQGFGGYNRAAYWIGSRKTADYAAVARMKSGNWSGDLVYFKADDRAKTDTKLGGGNINYAIENVVSFGAGFYVLDSDDERRDSMNVYNLRGGINPFAMADGIPALRPLRFDAEFVHEDAGHRKVVDIDNPDFANGKAWHITASYEFEDVPWKPLLSYRYARFDENYDSLFYHSSDWGTWFQGEILGEYVLANENLDSHMVKLRVQPLDPVTVNLIYYKFKLHDAAAGGASSDKYADEFDLIVDWDVNDHFSLSVVGAIASPDDAAKELTGGDNTWSYVMVLGGIKF